MQKILSFNFGEILWFKKWIYICPTFLAIIGVMFSVIPYVILGSIVVKLLEGSKNCIFYLKTADLWLGTGFFTVSAPYVPTLRLSMRLLILCLSLRQTFLVLLQFLF